MLLDIQVDVVYLDFAKAFDSIDHVILVEKLKSLNIDADLENLILNYLHDRSHRVVIGNYISNPITPKRGVPQGSSLGSPLFTVYINEIVDCISSFSLLFADDLKIFRQIFSKFDSERLQGDLDNINRWCLDNNIMLNHYKCQIMSFSKSEAPLHFPYKICDHKLSRVLSTRDLGVTFTYDLSFNDHITQMISSASKSLGYLI